MVPNPSYSGPVKPTLKEFVEVPFTSDTAEFNALVGGNVNFGYLPTQDVTQADQEPARCRAGNNPGCADFTLAPLLPVGDQLLPLQLQLDG